MKITEIFQILKNHEDVLHYAQLIADKQKDVKRVVMDKLITHYKLAADANMRGDWWYTVVPQHRCKMCDSPIMKVVGPFPLITCGGNSIIGCIKCGTMSSEKMMFQRKDIIICGT